jgi:large subunit ribosomal protein L7e
MADQPKGGKKESGKKEPAKDATPKAQKEKAPKAEATPKADKPKTESTKKESKGAKPESAKKEKPAEKPAAKPESAKKEKPAEKPKAEKSAEKPKAAPAPEKKVEKKAAASKPAATPAKAAPKKESKKAKAPKTEKKALPAAKAFWEKGSSATVPESVMKKRQRDGQLKAAADAHKLASTKALRLRRKVIFKRAEKYHNEYQSAERDEIRRRRQAKNNGNFHITPEPKIVLVVRMRGIMRAHPKTNKILQLLRLRQLNNAVFIKVNHATLTMLRLVEPYVTYGAPNLKTIKELIYKRGFGKVDRQRTPINDNSVIAKTLGKYGIICIEDLIHEIVTCGPNFKEVNNFLWPFKLNSPLGGWTDKGNHYTQGGDAGNREEDINTLVRRMN